VASHSQILQLGTKYTFDQLAAHLENDVHNQWELVAVTLRASIYLYRQAFAHAFEKIEGVQ
jgi:hypothetical protein